MSSLTKTPSIYIAGPDCFSPAASEFYDSVRKECTKHGWEALCPEYDSAVVSGNAIFHFNAAKIRSCDAVIANVSPWRGTEPDSGTAWEIGFAVALGKPVVMYTSDGRCVKDRVEGYKAGVAADGWAVEDFGEPVNLMLACSGPVVVGTMVDALRVLEPILMYIRTQGLVLPWEDPNVAHKK